MPKEEVAVLIYPMDVPSVSKGRVWLGPSVTQFESRMACCLAGAGTGVVTERSKAGLKSTGEFPLVHEPVTEEKRETLR